MTKATSSPPDAPSDASPDASSAPASGASPGPAPAEVLRMADQARAYILKALDFDVDGTHDTLPVVDHYLSDVPTDEAEICDLVATAVGSYFGEIMRERFGGDWVTAAEDPAGWRLELSSCTLSFFPVAMAFQAIQHGKHKDRYDDGVYVEPEDAEGLRQALELAPPVAEDVYYTLCNRFDTLEYIVELLMGRRAKAKEEEHKDGEPDGLPGPG